MPRPQPFPHIDADQSLTIGRHEAIARNAEVSALKAALALVLDIAERHELPADAAETVKAARKILEHP